MASPDHVQPRPRAYPRRRPSRSGVGSRPRNWAGNATLGRAGSVVTPADEAHVQSLLAGAEGPVRMLGSRMSPGRLLEQSEHEGTLLDLRLLRGPQPSTGGTTSRFTSSPGAMTFGGATRLDDVYTALSERGRMLPSSPGVIADQTLAGAIATGTHGQGLAQGSIADAALSIRMVLADGSVQEFDRDHEWFPAVQLGLGSLGVITAVTLDTRPSPVYTCVKSAVSADGLADDLSAWNRDHELVKAWWFPQENQVQVWAADPASDVDAARYHAGGGELRRHETTSNAMNDTVEQTLRQLRDDTSAGEGDKPGRTVTRFRDFTDVTGDIYQVFCRGIATPQINVEIAVPLADAGGMIKKIKDWHAETRPRMHYPVILRCTGPSQAWLSPSYGQDTCFFGFVVYYAEDGSLSEEGQDFLRSVEQVLAADGGRPHWGKYFDESRYDWPSLYPRWDAFRQVRQALDPRGRFANRFTTALFADRTDPR